MFLKKVYRTVFGDPNLKQVRALSPLVDEVNDLGPELQAMSDEEIKNMITEYRQELEADTADQRAEVAQLRQAASDAVREERQRLQVQLEQAERRLLRLEADLLEEIQPWVFAAVREASRRTIKLVHYDVQVVGGALLHENRVVEMRTGEGKTLVATMPTVLNALVGRGVHVITVNDYLAKRDCQWMGPIYHFLGLSVAVIQNAGGGGVDKASFQYNPDYINNDDRYQNLQPITRREAYHCDITYGTNNEYGFDYLRDNMVSDSERMAQRELHYAIIDEVDNILIDEARTPLIISGQAEESSEEYRRFAQLVTSLRPSSPQSVEDEEPDGDYVVDTKTKVSYLTEQGIEKIEAKLGVENLYDGESAALTPYLDNALRAKVLFKRDVDYVVQDGEVVIVDEFTGRLMPGRRYSEGLHQAIEAKEGVQVRNESFTWATVTFQNFFRMYNKLAGMTGTAETEIEEFGDIYKLEVTVLPTNVEYRSLQGSLIKDTKWIDGAEAITYRSPDGSEFYHKRIDFPDVVYKSPEAKFNAIAEEIKEIQETGQPVLVGTIAIETSEYLSDLLKKRGVKHEILNAKQHEREATIIAQAGQPGKVTIATNMAGRGVDILLGGNAEGLARDELRRQGEDLTTVDPDLWEQTLQKWQAFVAENRAKVKELGGLHVIGTERHDARRIDNQLRGRAGRQGDPGSSRFFVSLGDDLMKRFGGQSVANLMERFGVDDVPIEAGIVSTSIENAQTKVEGHNFDIRKHLLKYDDVVNQQRETIYAERRRILQSSDLSESILNMVETYLTGMVQNFTASDDPLDWDLTALHQQVQMIMPVPEHITVEHWANLSPQEIEDELVELAEQNYDDIEENKLGSENMRRWEKMVMLRTVDERWVRHLTALDSLRQGIGLQAYGQRDPLVEFKRQAYDMYGQLRDTIQEGVVQRIYRPQVMFVIKDAADQPSEDDQPAEETNGRKANWGLRPRNIQTVHADAATAGATATPQPVRTQNEPGRNETCPCGSGKKYKHCHGRKGQSLDGIEAEPVGAAAPAPATGTNKTRGKKKKSGRR